MQNGHWDEYNIIKNQYKKLIKIKKTKYMENKINSKANNSREMWKYLIELTNLKEQKGEIKAVKINGIIYENAQEIVENLNKFFVNSIKDINESIEQYEY